MSPWDLNKKHEAYSSAVESIKNLESTLEFQKKARDEVKEELIKYHITELLSLGITAQELEEQLVEQKLKEC